MSTFSRVLANANTAIFMLLALASIREYRRGHGPATGWAAAAFVTLGSIAALALIPGIQDDTAVHDQLWWQLFVKVIIAALVAFPYFLYRLAATFHEPSPRLSRAINLLTIAVVGAAFVLPRFPDRDDPRPAWLLVYSGAILVEWTATSVLAAVWLWRAGLGRPTVARYRMHLLAVGTVALNIMILTSVVRPRTTPDDPNNVIQAINILTGLIFYVGLAPPHFLIERWRRPEQQAAREATAELMTAVTAEEVAARILPHMITIVGAESATLYTREGDIFASFGELHPGAEKDDPDKTEKDGVLRFPLDVGGALVVRSSTYSPLFGSDKREILKSFAGLTDLALARCAAIAREREFISNAAHELRTPLTTMTAIAGMLATDREKMTPEEMDAAVAALVRQGKRSHDLVHTLLDMALIERGAAMFADEAVNLSEVVQESLASAPAPDGCQVRVEVHESIRVRGDAARLQQVIVNLLTNAYRYGGKMIVIDAHDHPSGVVMSITDDGDGVPSDLVPTLFEPFTRAVGSNMTGSGLGLAICRRIVNALGGSIVYEPEPVGSRFRVELRKAA